MAFGCTSTSCKNTPTMEAFVSSCEMAVL